MTTSQGAAPKEKKHQHRWRIWLGLLITLGCVVWAVWALDWSGVRAQLAQAQLGWLLAATGALFARVTSRTVRWRVFFAPPRPGFIPALTALIVGQTVNYIAPVWAGDLGRTYLLGNQTGHRKGMTLSTVVLDKLCDLILFLLFLAVLPFWVDLPKWLQPALQTVGLAAMLGMGLLFLGLVRRNWVLGLVGLLGRPLPGSWRDNALGLTRSLLDGLTMLRHPSTLALAMVWSLILWGLDAAAHFFVFRAVNLDLPLVAAVFLSTALRAGFALPAMPAQVGIYEGIVIAGLGIFGVKSEVALGVGLLRHAVDFVPLLVATVLLLAFRQSAPLPEVKNESGTG